MEWTRAVSSIFSLFFDEYHVFSGGMERMKRAKCLFFEPKRVRHVSFFWMKLHFSSFFQLILAYMQRDARPIWPYSIEYSEYHTISAVLHVRTGPLLRINGYIQDITHTCGRQVFWIKIYMGSSKVNQSK